MRGDHDRFDPSAAHACQPLQVRLDKEPWSSVRLVEQFGVGISLAKFEPEFSVAQRLFERVRGQLGEVLNVQCGDGSQSPSDCVIDLLSVFNQFGPAPPVPKQVLTLQEGLRLAIGGLVRGLRYRVLFLNHCLGFGCLLAYGGFVSVVR